jgi:preprotein translocase subunit YajC
MSSSLLLPVLVVVIIFFFVWQWRGNRRRRAEDEKKSAQLVKGVDVMTNFGLFGTVDSVDLENNKVVLETSPGHFVTVHRQTIARIETPAEAEAAGDVATPAAPTGTTPSHETTSSAIDEANAAARAQAAGSDKPQFGERKSDD